MLLAFDTSRDAPFEIGARLDAALCYPNFDPDRQMKFANAICARQFEQWMALEPHRKDELQPVLREYRKFAERASLSKLEERRKKALVAGQSFLPLLKKAMTGQLPILTGKYINLSRNKIAAYLWPPLDGGHEINY